MRLRSSPSSIPTCAAPSPRVSPASAMWSTLSPPSSMLRSRSSATRTDSPIGYKAEGDFPCYGNDDERADEIAVRLLKTFMNMIRKHHTYRNSEPTCSILTITSNVVYGKATGMMPDGRPAQAPLSPVPTRATAQRRTACSLHSTLWLSCRTSTLSTVSPTRRPSTRVHSATTTQSVPTRW